MLHKMTRHHGDLVLVSDWLSRPRKATLMRRLRLHRHIRAIVNTSTVQMEFEATRLGIPRDKLHHEPLPVDERFWLPGGPPTGRMICSVGWEARDYRTLFRAVEGLDLQVQLAVGITALGGANADTPSNAPLARFEPLRNTFSFNLHKDWMDDVAQGRVPANVRVDYQLSPRALRDLYAGARFVVVPLHDVDSDCGMTTITEALAMGKALIVTATRGQVDVVRDGEHGLYVPPGDATALRSAIEYLLANPGVVDRMGRAGRALAESRHSLDRHVQRLGALLTRSRDDTPGRRAAGRE